VRLGLCPPEDALRVRAHLTAVGLPTSRRIVRGAELGTGAMLAAMVHDKKAQGGRPRFVLSRGIGRAFAGAEVETAELEALLAAVL
jgi:3-dehydroquinate synthase